ncbi:MAG: YihY/virulence factor BrkB family protein [Lysobacterales bacterium]|nr:MAG: YihY/virulence factor BrkB family protein [Xanthomonadales bacterium]
MASRVSRQTASPRAVSLDAPANIRAPLHAWPLMKCAVSHWMSDQAATIGAALAFYCAFSLAPLLIILVTVVGWIVGVETASSQLSAQLTSLFGAATAETLVAAMEGSQSADGVAASVISIVSLLVGATTVFAALEAALEQIWGARALAPKGMRGWLRARVLSFGLILAVGFLLLVSLSLSTALSALRETIAARFAEFVVFAAVLDFAISIGLITGLIALIYRYLPARRLAWRPILTGALITALLFHLGRWAIGLYLGRSTQPSAFGAAASFVAMLLWLYYSAQIFLLGAEFTACLGGARDAPRAHSSTHS